MTIQEPMTLATDYLLAMSAVVFAAGLWRLSRLWSLAFLCTAIASLAGGSYHGFGPMLEPIVAAALWKLTLFAVGCASFFLLTGTSRSLAVFAAIKLVVYASWMITHDDFVWVIADYGSTLLIVGAVFLARWLRQRDPATPWVLASIIVSVIAALVQQSEFALHRHFNHNDLYHLIQVVALWLLYRGGRLAATNAVTDRPTTPPT
jgi:hypothetical protein